MLKKAIIYEKVGKLFQDINMRRGNTMKPELTTTPEHSKVQRKKYTDQIKYIFMCAVNFGIIILDRSSDNNVRLHLI